MEAKQESTFWETIKIFYDEGLLPYVMIVGSWAEYIYSDYFKTGFTPNLRTRDVDFLYRNLRKPPTKINIAAALTKSGYVYLQNPSSGTAKFIKEDILEVEFLTRALGSGAQHIYEIPSLGIKAEGLPMINMLCDYPLELNCREYPVIVPEPAAYVLQKILVNPTRSPHFKRQKDIDGVKTLLEHIKQSEHDAKRIKTIMDKFTQKELRIIEKVCKENDIELFLPSGNA